MKVSLNWVKELTKVDIPVDELVEKVGAQLGAVDEVIDLGKKYEGALIVKVVECDKHPNADKLSVCMIDAGKPKLIRVVCGAPNVAAGQLVVWLPPGVTVPSTYDKDPFVLEARELRGVMSNGMIASARELALGDDHTGILVLDRGKPGTSFAEEYGLDDTIIDIENKMFTHRPDLFGMLGIARELAGIQGKPFKSPTWYEEDANLYNDGRKNVLKLTVKNELVKLVPRFTAVAIKDVKVEDSPAWLRARLSSVGVRPINNIVDMTNFLMLETAQPLHAYDYDKVNTGVLGVRQAKAGEKVTVIGGKEIKLKAGVIVITDGARAIGFGGVMGGADTEVDKSTKNIILEVANFDMNTTRRTAMEYGLFTDAATRFTKNQSSHQQKAILCKAVEMTKKLAGGRVSSPIIDINHAKGQTRSVEVTVDFINQRLGLDLSASQMKKLLENVEFKVGTEAGKLSVTIPFWRTDIEIAEDVTEEIGRLYGYDHLPLNLPKSTIKAAGKDELFSFRSKVRDLLGQAGANEVLTYSFVHESLLQKSGQDSADAYHIRNALSPDLQYYRLSLTPSLLEKIHSNLKNGFEQFAIFEMNKVHVKSLLDEEKLPKEFNRLSLVFAQKKDGEGAAFYQAKRYLDYLVRSGLGVSFKCLPLNEVKNLTREWQIAAGCYEPKRSAVVVDKLGGVIGLVGEPIAGAVGSLKLPAYCAIFELDLDALNQAATARHYVPLNIYPEINQDLCLRLPAGVTYDQTEGLLLAELDKALVERGYQHRLEPIDIFQRPQDKNHKQITWHINLFHPDRTLTTDEVNKIFDMISGDAKAQLKAERV